MSDAWLRQEGETATDWLARLESVARQGLDNWSRTSLGIYLDSARRQAEQDRMSAAKAEVSAAEAKAAQAEAAEIARQENAAVAQARRAATEDLSHRALAALARPRRSSDLGEAKAAYRRLNAEQRLRFADWLARGAPDEVE
jgi:hypothetical protein